MKTVDEYFQLPYRMEIIEDKDEGGFVVNFPDLPGCLTCGETVEEPWENATDAKRCWLEAALEDGSQFHCRMETENYSGQFKIRMPKSLHRSLAGSRKARGISMNQYCIYLLSKNDAVFSK